MSSAFGPTSSTPLLFGLSQELFRQLPLIEFSATGSSVSDLTCPSRQAQLGVLDEDQIHRSDKPARVDVTGWFNPRRCR